MKYAFLCRKGMLSGTFARNQFFHLEGNILITEKMSSPDLAISVKEASRLHSLKARNSQSHLLRMEH